MKKSISNAFNTCPNIINNSNSIQDNVSITESDTDEYTTKATPIIYSNNSYLKGTSKKDKK